MRHTTTRVAGRAFVIFGFSLALNPSLLVPQSPHWTTHTSERWGFHISYPADWMVVVAAEGRPGAGSEAETLSGDEIYKVTFMEPENQVWPGRYEVRLLENRGGEDLDAVLSRFDLADLWENQPADTVLDGHGAKTWVRWRADSLTREFLAVFPQGILHLQFEESTPNDPAMAAHKMIYAEITRSLSFENVR